MLADFYIYNEYTRYVGDFPNAFLVLVLRRIQDAKLSHDTIIDDEQLMVIRGDNNWTREH